MKNILKRLLLVILICISILVYLSTIYLVAIIWSIFFLFDVVIYVLKGKDIFEKLFEKHLNILIWWDPFFEFVEEKLSLD